MEIWMSEVLLVKVQKEFGNIMMETREEGTLVI